MITLNTVSLNINGKTLLKPTTITLPSGKITAIIGPNGSGKSTLLKVMAGEFPKLDSQVAYFNRPLLQWSIEQRAKVRSVLSQQWHLPFAYQVWEVINMGNNHQPGTQPSRRLMSLAESLGLSALMHQDYQTLSGGEQQRVQLARAFLQLADSPISDTLMLLDEPMSAQDLKYQTTILHLLKQQAQQGQTIVIILHDLHLATRFSDFTVLMKKGEITDYGPTHETLSIKRLENVFDTRFNLSQNLVNQETYPVIAF